MPSRTSSSSSIPRSFSRASQLLLLLAVWAAIYGLSLWSPALLDDVDSGHAQAAQYMLRTGDWVTLHLNGIRYLEKAPFPYWIAAISLRLFGMNTFAIHLPIALAVLGMALLAWTWGHRAFDLPTPASSSSRQTTGTGNTGFYAGLFTLTAAGVFLFTRIFIPEALLSLLLATILYATLRALELPASESRAWAYAAWTALAAAVLTKGLIAIVFIVGALLVYLLLSGDLRHWRRLHLATGLLVFLVVATPWHILAGIRNRGGANGHGFFWFYFINEHVLRFLGRRQPVDYNKLPATLYWTLHLVWLFPWSFFLPAVALVAWRSRDRIRSLHRTGVHTFAERSLLLLGVFSALVLLFFSLSTNQEYYTFPTYLPLLLIIAAGLARLEHPHAGNAETSPAQRSILWSHIALAAFGVLVAAALAFGLWTSRGLPPVDRVGDLFAHRGVGDYTLSTSHLFDLTGASFSALRLPATLACVAFLIGPGLALYLRRRANHPGATLALAAMSTVFLIAAHIALVRFSSLLSSADFATKIQQLEHTGAAAPDSDVLLYGDQSFGSSIAFYLGHPVKLVDGRSTSLLFGSTFPDSPLIFLTHEDLQAQWGKGKRKLLFVPLEHRDDVDRLLDNHRILLYESSGKALYTDRPLGADAP